MAVWLCRWTALHFASQKGHTETALALVKAGADVHCKTNAGCDSRGCILVSLNRHSVGADGPSTRGGAARVPVRLCRSTALHLASANGHTETALALVKAGADVNCKEPEVGYGLWGCILLSVGLPQCRGGRSVHSGVELQECLLRLCRLTALHYASQNGHTETALALVKAGADVHCTDNDGYGSALWLPPGVVGLPQCGGGRSVHHSMWSCRSACFDSAGSRRCTMRRRTAAQLRRWRW